MVSVFRPYARVHLREIRDIYRNLNRYSFISNIVIDGNIDIRVSLSPQCAASSGCGRRHGVQIRRVAAIVFKKLLRTADNW